MKKSVLSKAAALTLTAVTATTGLSAVYFGSGQNVIAKQDNGYYSMTGMDNGTFDKEKTPVSNMLILLKILNNSALCDSEWYQEVAKCITMLQAQIDNCKNSNDENLKELMRLQQDLVDTLQNAYAEMCEENINRLQNAYNRYHDYYYSIYEGGAINGN